VKGAPNKMLEAAERGIKISGWKEGDKQIYKKYKDVGNIKNRNSVFK
jgi:hypothetical protein